MNEQWLVDPLAGYQENAPRLFSYPESTALEYVRDVGRFIAWLRERQVPGAEDGKSVVLLTCTSLVLCIMTVRIMNSYIMETFSSVLLKGKGISGWECWQL